MRRAYDVACQTGDLTYSAYGWHELITNYLTVGDPLKMVQGEAETGSGFRHEARFRLRGGQLRGKPGPDPDAPRVDAKLWLL